MAPAAPKAPGAFRTIGELSRDTGLPQHVLRYWETRFPQLRPVTRAGNRRYYRPEDAALVARIDVLLNQEGYTIRGVQQLLDREGKGGAPTPAAPPASPPATDADAATLNEALARLRTIRDLLARALAEDAAA